MMSELLRIYIRVRIGQRHLLLLLTAAAVCASFYARTALGARAGGFADSPRVYRQSGRPSAGIRAGISRGNRGHPAGPAH